MCNLHVYIECIGYFPCTETIPNRNVKTEVRGMYTIRYVLAIFKHLSLARLTLNY